MHFYRDEGGPAPELETAGLDLDDENAVVFVEAGGQWFEVRGAAADRAALCREAARQVASAFPGVDVTAVEALGRFEPMFGKGGL